MVRLPPKLALVDVDSMNLSEICETLKAKASYFHQLADSYNRTEDDGCFHQIEYRNQGKFFDRVVELLEDDYEGELEDEELMNALREGMKYLGPLRKLKEKK